MQFDYGWFNRESENGHREGYPFFVFVLTGQAYEAAQVGIFQEQVECFGASHHYFKLECIVCFHQEDSVGQPGHWVLSKPQRPVSSFSHFNPLTSRYENKGLSPKMSIGYLWAKLCLLKTPLTLRSSARHASFHETATADGVLGYLIAFLVLLATVKLWHLLRLNPKLQMISATLRRAWNDISGFLIVMTIMLSAYSIAVSNLELNSICVCFLSSNQIRLCSHCKLRCLLLLHFYMTHMYHKQWIVSYL